MPKGLGEDGRVGRALRRGRRRGERGRFLREGRDGREGNCEREGWTGRTGSLELLSKVLPFFFPRQPMPARPPSPLAPRSRKLPLSGAAHRVCIHSGASMWSRRQKSSCTTPLPATRGEGSNLDPKPWARKNGFVCWSSPTKSRCPS
jgi:hypothetical protein